MPSLLPLLLTLSSSLSAAFALPLEPRIVGTVTCSPFNFTTTSTNTTASSTGLYVNEVGLSQVVELGLEADGLTIGREGDETEQEGVFGFEVCESKFMKSANTNTSLVGHATYTALNGSRFCLTTTYPYTGQTPSLSPCWYSDDSRQFLAWWSLDLAPNATYFTTSDFTSTYTELNITTQINTLEFLGPVRVAVNPLSPDAPISSTGNLTLEPETTPSDGDEYAYFFFA